jgi:hypothetical protein
VGRRRNDATRLRRDRSPSIVIRNASIPALNNSSVAPRKSRLDSRLDSRLENRIEIRRSDRGATNRSDELDVGSSRASQPGAAEKFRELHQIVVAP